jgi:hypothetical protein
VAANGRHLFPHRFFRQKWRTHTEQRMIAVTVTLQEEEAQALANFIDRIDFETVRRFGEAQSPRDIQDSVATRTLGGLATLRTALGDNGWEPLPWHSRDFSAQ